MLGQRIMITLRSKEPGVAVENDLRHPAVMSADDRQACGVSLGKHRRQALGISASGGDTWSTENSCLLQPGKNNRRRNLPGKVSVDLKRGGLLLERSAF